MTKLIRPGLGRIRPHSVCAVRRIFS